MSAQTFKHEDPSSSEYVEWFEIAHQMKIANLSDDFISSAVITAMEYEGVSDLLKLWRDEHNENERNGIIADIQDLIDDIQS